MDRFRITGALILFASALLMGAIGAQGCNLYVRHAEQHRAAEEDHKLLLQVVPIVNGLLEAEKQRQAR